MIGAQTNLCGEIRVEQTHDRSGQLDKHEIALRAAPELHRENTTVNTDNELTRERMEEDMDFKIPGLPHSIVKQLQSASVRELIQKIENHPNRHALQRDLQQRQQFNVFSKESKQMIHEVETVDLCELPKSTLQSMSTHAGRRRSVYCTCEHFLRNGTEENITFVQHTMDLLSIPNYFLNRETQRAPLWEEARRSRVLHREFAQEEVQEETFLGYSQPVHPRREVAQEHD